MEQKISFSIVNMMCEACVNKITSALKNEGIDAQINLRFKKATVEKKDEEKAKEIIRSLGYEVK